MNSALPPTTSGPPPASSWATPPEFYLDECTVTKRVRRLLLDLGYVVHTPPELYGGRDKSSGVKDKVWLPDVGKRGWAVLGTDTMIFQHPDEYQAYLQARVPVFLLPGASKVAERVALVEANLAKMCAEATQLKSAVWVLTMTGIVPYQAPAAAKRSRKA